ncbi:TPA: hypothetical protein MDT59_004769 [Klebsiella pneumoniae]|uniref:hypothetical protein n=1 Tax=Klebsiella pneumoniae TaxID=573 RepID=UPI0015F3415B|nr:hypothetical protein [Klebsiella pneumoniae]HBV2923942.1 hypothetical protein [Klebsiella pneumoniae]
MNKTKGCLIANFATVPAVCAYSGTLPNNSVTVAVAISVNWRSDFLTMGFLILEDTK